MSEQEKFLVPITASAVELYEGGGLTVLLDEIEKRALELVPDVTTTKGRDALRTNAATVTSYKTKLFQLGKDLTEEHRNKVQSINSVRNSMEERLNTLKDKVRKPLTDYEEIEKARVAKVECYIVMIKEMATAPIEHDSAEIQHQLDELTGIIVDDSFGDLETPAFIEKEKSIEKLTAQLETVKQREKDQKELADLRKKNEERDAKESTERAEKEQAERDERIRKEAAEKAETEAAEREEKLKRDLVDQEEKAEREKQQAIADEQKRVKDAAEADRIAEVKREENKNHCRKINKLAVTALRLHCEIDETQAKKVIAAIAKGNITRVSIQY